ncbi:MAG: hypothetical protein RLY50_13, partial [Actinomycetota bacterium]
LRSAAWWAAMVIVALWLARYSNGTIVEGPYEGF